MKHEDRKAEEGQNGVEFTTPRWDKLSVHSGESFCWKMGLCYGEVLGMFHNCYFSLLLSKDKVHENMIGKLAGFLKEPFMKMWNLQWLQPKGVPYSHVSPHSASSNLLHLLVNKWFYCLWNPASSVPSKHTSDVIYFRMCLSPRFLYGVLPYDTSYLLSQGKV